MLQIFVINMITLPKGVWLDSEESDVRYLYPEIQAPLSPENSECIILVGMDGHLSLPTEAFAISDTPGQMTHIMTFIFLLSEICKWVHNLFLPGEPT